MDTFDEESLHLQLSLDDEIELVRNHSVQVPHLGCGLLAAKLARVTGCFQLPIALAENLLLAVAAREHVLGSDVADGTVQPDGIIPSRSRVTRRRSRKLGWRCTGSPCRIPTFTGRSACCWRRRWPLICF
jgi:hypothetical protein